MTNLKKLEEKSFFDIALWGAIFFYIIIFSFLVISKYNSYAYGDFDFAHHAQTLWNILHGSIDCSILGLKFLGNHANIILFFIAPLYAIFPHPELLLILQTVFLALSAWPIYLIGKKVINKRVAFVVSACYLLYPAVGYINLFEFHTEPFAIFFLAFAFYYFLKDRFWRYTGFLFLALTCKENVALVVIMMGFYAILQKKGKRWAITPILMGLFWFLIYVGLVMPHYNKGEVGFYSLYSHLGKTPKELLLNVALLPIKHPGFIFSPLKINYLMELFTPLSFLSLLSPSVLLIAFPIFLQRFLSNRPTECTIYYHYTSLLVPYIFISAIYGIKKLEKLSFIKERVIILILISASLMSNYCLGPQLDFLNLQRSYKKDALDYKKDELVKLIPKDAPVVSSFEFLSHLANRRNLYSFHYIYSGHYTISDKKFITPENIEYALINFNDSLLLGFENNKSHENLANFFAKDWTLIESFDEVALFKKGYEGKKKILFELVENPVIGNKHSVIFDDAVEFLGFDMSNISIKRGSVIAFTFYWKALKSNIPKDFWVGLELSGSSGSNLLRIRELCYGIYPASLWKKDQIIKEKYNLLIPSDINRGEYGVKITLVDPQNGLSALATTYEKGILDKDGKVFLMEIKIGE